MSTAVFAGLDKFKDFGLLVLRLGLGVAFVLHGYPKMLGGPERWEQLGQVMDLVGIRFYPVVWGFLAAFAELGGGILMILGLLFRPAALLLFATMCMATAFHISKGDPFSGWAHPFEMAAVFFGLLLLGPGRLSVDGK
ncbi:MAG TPA: DoxX family protein [Thermoanaerobaculia bacterium]|nr:DoxX family protein [Thermoanaerobaculia bacterium]